VPELIIINLIPADVVNISIPQDDVWLDIGQKGEVSNISKDGILFLSSSVLFIVGA
jgi:hypothetical protein